MNRRVFLLFRGLLVAGLFAVANPALAYWTYYYCQQDVDLDTVGSGSVWSQLDSPCAGVTSSHLTIATCTIYLMSQTCPSSYPGENDNCPSVANADQSDMDGDGQGNVCDSDTDGDGRENGVDNCPLNSNQDQLDTDGDGVGELCDLYPSDPAESADSDGDGTGNNADNCSSVANADQLNTDGDAQGNACDSDDDNDGVADTSDKFPLNVAASSDSDNDGYPGSWNATCNATCQAGSGLVLDNCPSITNPGQQDDDNDGFGNACDPDWRDDDNDGVRNSIDNCPTISNASQLNTDGDAQGDVCDSDDDNDGYSDSQDDLPKNVAASWDSDKDGSPNAWNPACDEVCQANSGLVLDNCPSLSNANQLDTDSDLQGDACDADDDNDGVADISDECPRDPLASVGTNADNDALCDANDTDDDNDGLLDGVDNCSVISNADQLNTDGDAQGNVCDSDDDNDGINDAEEIALGLDPLVFNHPESYTLISFEQGVPAGWSKPAAATASWSITNVQSSHKAMSLRSGWIGNNAKTQIEFVANIASSAFVFDIKTSTDPSDVFRVYVDGVGKLAKAGELPWQTVSVAVTPGTHTIRFEYAKNGSGVAGTDVVWIDKLVYLDGADTDADGQANYLDPDDDNDGLPDVMDPLPLQVKFNRDAVYKGTTVSDQQGVQ